MIQPELTGQTHLPTTTPKRLRTLTDIPCLTSTLLRLSRRSHTQQIVYRSTSSLPVLRRPPRPSSPSPLASRPPSTSPPPPSSLTAPPPTALRTFTSACASPTLFSGSLPHHLRPLPDRTNGGRPTALSERSHDLRHARSRTRSFSKINRTYMHAVNSQWVCRSSSSDHLSARRTHAPLVSSAFPRLPTPASC